MVSRSGRRALLAVGMIACALSFAAPAYAQTPPVIDTTGGRTQPVFGYADAIRERVFIDSPYDSDHNGVTDIIAIDIKRPKATNEGLKAPVWPLSTTTTSSRAATP
jgi:X-Pro dipeptidyl-peptidase